MSAQNDFEKTLKEVHLMLSECPNIKGDYDSVVVSKSALLKKLEKMTESMYAMLDEFGLNAQNRREEQGRMQRQHKEIIEKATVAAEDIYSASVIYTDEAITRLVRLLDNSEKSVELLYVDLEKKLQREKQQIRANQKELENMLFEMRDANLYIQMLNERRRQVEQEKENLKKASQSIPSPAYPKPEIKINKAYFEQMGINEDGTPKEPVEEKKEPAEVKVNTESNYFKWKKEQEGKKGKSKKMKEAENVD